MDRYKSLYPLLSPGTIIGSTSMYKPSAATIRATCAGVSHTFNPCISSHISVVCEEHGLYYIMSMKWPRIRQEDFNDFGKLWKDHIVFIATPQALVQDRALQEKANNFLLKSHELRIKYDFPELLKFWGIATSDEPERLICSDLSRNMLSSLGIYYPPHWNDKCSPYDQQIFLKMQNCFKWERKSGIFR